MFDQSFTAKNIELVFNIENRKGHIDYNRMPLAYNDIVADIRLLQARIKTFNNKKRSTWTNEDIIHYKLDKQTLDKLKCEKYAELQSEFAAYELLINNPCFSFNIKVSDYQGKQCFTIENEDWSQHFAMRILQRNLTHLFNVEMVNRHTVMTDIKLLLNTKTPLYIIRTDVESFFESIPHERLFRLLERNSLLGTKSKSMVKKVLLEYERIKDTSRVPAKQGVPRGIAISSPLSEIYMDSLDKKIRGRREVIYYARYVDDIFLILSSLGEAKDIKAYYGDLEREFAQFGLVLQPEGTTKCKLIDRFSKDATGTDDLSYLGYQLYMSKVNDGLKTVFGLSDKRKKNFKKRIDNCFDRFSHIVKINPYKARCDLLDGLNIISGNIRLSNAKNGVKAGFYYNNDLLDHDDDFIELQNYLNNKVLSIPSNVLGGGVNRTEYENHLSSIVRRINLKQRWEDRKMYDIRGERLNSIERWLLRNAK